MGSSTTKQKYSVAVSIGKLKKPMEDAAIHKVDLGDGNSLFRVFDGHGGSFACMQVKK